MKGIINTTKCIMYPIITVVSLRFLITPLVSSNCSFWNISIVHVNEDTSNQNKLLVDVNEELVIEI
jgi:hypothetical protein